MMTKLFGNGIALLAAVLLAPASALAQGSTPMPLAKAVVSNEVASRTLFKYQVNAQVARQLVDACVDFARTQPNGPGTYAIFVLAPNGDIIDAHVMDGVVPIGAETGLMKAKTALYARSPSRAVADRFPTVEGRLIRTDLGRDSGLSYYFVPGGVPIVLESQLIGAMGVGGGNMDEQCVYSALTKVLGIQPPPPAPAAEGRGAGAGGRGGQSLVCSGRWAVSIGVGCPPPTAHCRLK
ncbi:MAG: heme-binding protein [Acidobacteria bacterium]|nr:heme-binding protein [Acidobacteriota bacterium]